MRVCACARGRIMRVCTRARACRRVLGCRITRITTPFRALLILPIVQVYALFIACAKTQKSRFYAARFLRILLLVRQFQALAYLLPKWQALP